MNSYKCGNTGHFANQCHVRQGFQPGLNVKRPPQPVRMLVDSAPAIKLIKENILDKQDIRQKHFKKFVMGRDEHTSTETVKLNFFNKEHVFQIIANDFPLPEDGIIGLKFFSK